jgi:hypothetical protein
MRLIIAGTGRSGSGYMFKLFNSLGVPCGHEEVYNVLGYRGWESNWDGAKWRKFENFSYPLEDEFQADSTWCVVPYLEEMDKEDTILYHVVRETSSSWVSQMSSHHDTEYGRGVRDLGGPHGGFWTRKRSDPEVGPWLDYMMDHGASKGLHPNEANDPYMRSIQFLSNWTEEITSYKDQFKHSFTNRVESLHLEDIRSILELLGRPIPDDLEDLVSSIDTMSNKRPRFYGPEDLPTDDSRYKSLKSFYESIP